MERARAIDHVRHGQSQQVPLEEGIARLAEAQHGLVSRTQLVRMGLGRGAIEHRLAAGWLRATHRGVYAVGHRPDTRGARFMTALLSVGEDAVLSHRSAAGLWGLRSTGRERVDVTVARALGRPDGIDLHRTRLAPDEVTRCDGIPVTTPARTLLDLAAVLDRRRLRRALEQAEALRLGDPVSLAALMERHLRRKGSGNLRAILADGALAPSATRSQLEDLFLSFVDEAGLPRPQVNAVLRIAGGAIEVDFWWPAHGIVIELDGHSFHSHREAFERDRERDRRLQAAGVRVVRVTWRQLQRGRAALRRDLGRLLGQPPKTRTAAGSRRRG